MNWGKSRTPARATSKISFLIGKNLEVRPKTNTQKILFPYLSFTVENKIGSLHNIRLLTFQT